MGSGTWDPGTYSATESARAASGRSAFAYSDDIRSGRIATSAHESLNPHGVKVRESRDSAEHPNSTAIAVWFDVTGSMHQVPTELQKKLPELFGLLLRKGYVTDPQIMMAAIGDAISDSVPVQAGQFESDNRIDANLGNIYLEGGGGGGNHESYELALYFMARHTEIDCFDKHGRRGYLFIIADEKAYEEVDHRLVEKVFGDKLQESISLKDILEEVKRRYHVFYLHPQDASYVGERVNIKFWTDLLGQNYIQNVTVEAVCETIASLIGSLEGTVESEDEIASHLRDVGASEHVIGTTVRAVAPFVGSTAVAVGAGPALPSVQPTESGGGRRL